MAPREQPSFDPNKYLDGPEYGTMGKHKLTSKEVKEIADARIAKAERDAEEAKSKAADQASAVA